MIIGEKIKTYKKYKHDRDDGKKNVRYVPYEFTDLELSEIMFIEGESLDLYNCETIKKIINCQWVETKKITRVLFFIFLFLFLFPFCRSLLLSDDKKDAKEKKVYVIIGLIPIFIQFMIEIVQMYNNGLSYFIGWNWADLLFIMSYSYYAYSKVLEVSEDEIVWFPELKLTIVILSFVKLMFYIRIFDKFGFLVQMIIFCVSDLIPFMVFYFMCLFMFTIVL